MSRPLRLLLALSLGLPAVAVAATSAAAAPLPSRASDSAAEAVPDELLVGYVAGAGEAAKQRARGRAAATPVEQVVPAGADRTEVELVRLPAGKDRGQAVAALQSDPAVRYAEPNWVYRAFGKPAPAPSTPTTPTAPSPLNEPEYVAGHLWGLGAVGTPGSVTDSAFGSQAAAVWPVTSASSASPTVYVGVIDEGIKTTHPDLLGKVGNPGEIAGNRKDDDGYGYVDDADGWDFAGRNNTVYDGGPAGTSDNHGTHVAGTIAANADGKGVVGLAPTGVKLISAKFLGPNGGDLANAVKAVDYFTDLKKNHGVNVVATNNSWGGGGYSTALHDAIVRSAREGILFVAAAGNGGADGVGDDNNKGDSYPSDYETNDNIYGDSRLSTDYDAVVGVAAIDKTGALAGFSNYGATEVDLGAPGVDILSTTANNGGYSYYSGTSMATPHVTAALALQAAANTSATGAQRVSALLARTAPTESLSGKVLTNGRLDVQKLLATPAQ
ncbi:MAG: Peptidase [Frankiales bacterium]|nr:Peptidase [Frankiales bacterium]